MDYLAQQVGILFEILPGNIGDVDVKPGHNASIKGEPNKNAGCYQTIYDVTAWLEKRTQEFLKKGGKK